MALALDVVFGGDAYLRVVPRHVGFGGVDGNFHKVGIRYLQKVLIGLFGGVFYEPAEGCIRKHPCRCSYIKIRDFQGGFEVFVWR